MGFEPMMRVLQTLALPLGHVAMPIKKLISLAVSVGQRAGDGARTHDLLLGKEAFYQWNYTRMLISLPVLPGSRFWILTQAILKVNAPGRQFGLVRSSFVPGVRTYFSGI